jgi:hypothetical protein
MKAELTARHCLTHDRQPLAVVDGLPGGCAELRPAELRALAECPRRLSPMAPH